mmetsp:Transcript_74003/g.173584  ORF Transcript_74003/g.173584 Transcript_74003/m.173584 type:complete len:293 (-) Transcript_74003:3-881(-)
MPNMAAGTTSSPCDTHATFEKKRLEPGALELVLIAGFRLKNCDLVIRLVLELAQRLLQIFLLLHCGHGFFLLLLEEVTGGLVFRLQVLHLLLHPGFLLLHLVCRHLFDLLQVGVVFLVTILTRVGNTRHFGCTLHELVECLQVPGVFVRISIGGCARTEILEGRVALDAILAAQVFGVVHGAVHVHDNGIRVSLVPFGSQLVPIRFQLLAVTSPWCQELHEGHLPVLHRLQDLLVPVLRGCLEGFRRRAGHGAASGDRQQLPHDADGAKSEGGGGRYSFFNKKRLSLLLTEA